MTRRIKITVAYDGRPFGGWQSQPGKNTVQDYLQSAIMDITGHRLPVHGSGRTDTGVHALAQIAHFDVPGSTSLAAPAWCRALNAKLPPSIRVLSSCNAKDDFHARFDATGKTYRYRIYHGDVLPPLEHGLAWKLYGSLDLANLSEALRLFEGEHNFRAFAANRGDGAEKNEGHAIRTVRRASVSSEGPHITLEFEGDGFLYKMVRLLTGSAIRVAQHREEPSWIYHLLTDPSAPKSHHCAPADGLYLTSVHYG